MPTPFAALEARVNAAVFAHLANATADFGGGVVVDGVFDNAYAIAFDALAGTAPMFRCEAPAVSSVTVGQGVSIGGVGYEVVDLQPDGAGVVRMILEKV